MHYGIIGLPNVGKSTIFNALTKGHAAVANYPFTTIQFNKGIVTVPDERLNQLSEMVKPEKTTPTTIEFLDIAGLVKGAHSGEGLGNQFLSHITDVDAICHVVRCFEDEKIAHVYADLDPVRDIEVVAAELILKDLDTLDKRIKKTEPLVRSGDKKMKATLTVYQKIQAEFAKGIALREIILEREERELLKDLPLLTGKAVLLIANVREDTLPTGGPAVEKLCFYAKEKKIPLVILSGKIEAELIEIARAEQQQYLESYGLSESGLTKLIKVSYQLLDLITFYTIVGPEVRAWTVQKGTLAPQAAGKIHTDFERGFICAEVVSFNELMHSGSWSAAREAGCLHQHGKEYAIQDGDVCHFRFNV